MEVLEGLAEEDGRLKPIWSPNLGEMGARGVGVARAAGEIVVMLDDDVRTRPGLSRAHASWHAKGERLLVIGYMPTSLPRTKAPGHFATRLYAQEYENACKRYEAAPEQVLRYLWAGNLSLRRSDAIEVGLPNPSFSAKYHQDREFGLRCMKAGLVGVFDRSLGAEHIHYRNLAAFRRDAQAQGVGRRTLHEVHGDILGPLLPDEFEKGLLRPLRLVVRACRRPFIHRAVTATLATIVGIAGKMRLSGIEISVAKMLRRIEQARGSIDAAVSL